MRTYSPKKSEITRDWWVVDAEGMVLGRLASEVAKVLRGKHKPMYAPHLDCGDHVIIVNADKVVLTSDKGSRKILYRHSGYPGGIPLADLRRGARPQASRGGPPNRQGDAALHQARPPDGHQAQGVRRPHPSASGSEAQDPRDRPARHRVGPLSQEHP